MFWSRLTAADCLTVAAASLTPLLLLHAWLLVLLSRAHCISSPTYPPPRPLLWSLPLLRLLWSAPAKRMLRWPPLLLLLRWCTRA